MVDNNNQARLSSHVGDEWREKLGELMAEIVDGSLDPEQQRELIAILESSDEAKRYYLSYLQVHAELGHQWGGDRLPIRIDHSELANPRAMEHGNDSSGGRRLLRAVGWLCLGMAASGLFFVTWLGPQVERWLRTDRELVAMERIAKKDGSESIPDSHSSTSAYGKAVEPTRAELPSVGWADVAVVVRNEGIDDESLQVGKRIPPGTVRFDSGILQIQFMSGASMVLQGPAELQIESAKAARLSSGIAKTRVNERAKGFVLNTTEAAVVDIGTEFGLRFDESGHPEVEVTEGEVEFSLLGEDGSTLTSRRVQKSEVVAVDMPATGDAILSDKAKRRDDGPEILMPIVASPGETAGYSEAVRAGNPRVYWRFESESEGIVRNEMGDQWSAQLLTKPDASPTMQVDRGCLLLKRGSTPRCVTSEQPIHGLDDGAFSVEFWMNPDDLEHSHCVGLAPFGSKDVMAFLGVVEIVTDTFLIHQPGSLRTLYRNPPDRRHEYGKNIFSPGMVTPGQWHHAVMVKAEESLSLYLNGNLIRAVDVAPSTEASSPEGFRIILGQLTTVYTERQFAGSLDEFAIYDRALDPSEILEHYRIATTANSNAE